MTEPATRLADLRFDNSFLRELPGDPVLHNSRRQVLGAAWSRVAPTPVSAPSLVAGSPEVAALLGLSPSVFDSPDFAAVFAGNRLLKGMEPYAVCYGGHQFGSWAGQLGDGRAINLGEVVSEHGRFELQLKGAGPTPYSRMGDGRAVLRSSIREFLCSEAMHHLGVPTTRALSLVTTGDDVVRDMFYDGNPRPEPGAIVCRVAPSFIRFGNFQIAAARDDKALLTALVRHTMARHAPEHGEPTPDSICAWLADVGRQTAIMVAHWMRVGFVHGVMNTDNMSVLGLTIDYGPYGWLDDYDPNWTPNTTDAGGRRYRYGHQPAVAGWNLTRFAEALLPLVGSIPPLEQALAEYGRTVDAEQSAMMAAKLGLRELDGEEDEQLAADLLSMLAAEETDMTLFFRGLADVPTESDAASEARLAAISQAWYGAPSEAHTERTARWLERYAARARREDLPQADRRSRMNAVNPRYVLRNYLAQLAIDAAEAGDSSKVRELLDVMRRPYDDQPERAEYADKRPDWARNRPGCSMLSCSS